MGTSSALAGTATLLMLRFGWSYDSRSIFTTFSLIAADRAIETQRGDRRTRRTVLVVLARAAHGRRDGHRAEVRSGLAASSPAASTHGSRENRMLAPSVLTRTMAVPRTCAPFASPDPLDEPGVVRRLEVEVAHRAEDVPERESEVVRAEQRDRRQRGRGPRGRIVERTNCTTTNVPGCDTGGTRRGACLRFHAQAKRIEGSQRTDHVSSSPRAPATSASPPIGSPNVMHHNVASSSASSASSIPS
jgi:hypothetical protein